VQNVKGKALFLKICTDNFFHYEGIYVLLKIDFLNFRGEESVSRNGNFDENDEGDNMPLTILNSVVF